MKKLLVTLAIGVAMSSYAWAQLTLPLGGIPPNSTSKKTRPTSKTLIGTVLDKADHPIPDAVIYLKNTKTLAVKSVFAQPDGTYRFPQLALNTDYEVYAEKDGKKSDTKTVSQFDDRFNPTINLKINLDK